MTEASAAVPGLPAAEVAITRSLVRELLQEQVPQWAGWDLSYVATGWDNEVYRLGDELLIRLPRRKMGEATGRNERQWLPKLVRETGQDVASIVFAGQPNAAYPFTFSVVKYVPGQSAARIGRPLRDGYAPEMATYFRLLHQPATDPRPVSDYRGCPLQTLDIKTRGEISLLASGQRAAAIEVWRAAVEAPVHEGPPLWLHGDPHPHNTIIEQHGREIRLAALVDFGDLCTGDPASDLGAAWMHFTVSGTESFMAHYGVLEGSPLWLRARGWALRYAILTSGLAEQDPLGIVGRETLELLLR